MNSCIYRGTVRHRRHGPREHSFSYRLFMMYLDLDEVGSIFHRRWMWSSAGPAAAWFRRSDYLGDAQTDLPTSVRDAAERLTGNRPSGPIRVLTQLRYFGYMMNPVTFYYCFGPDGEQVETILAEITNTPWNERHTYALRSTTGPVCGPRHRFAKAFHVSPFMDMNHEYGWRFSDPGNRLFVHMENHVGADKLFDATLLLHREEIHGRSLASALARYPWMTAQVAAGIYWQALRLRLKRTPYHEHPEPQTVSV